MATPNPLYFMCPSLQDYFADKDNGAPLSAGIVTFYRDENHNTRKNVYQQIRNPNPPYDYQFVSLGSQLTLSSIGTFVDQNGADIIPYFYPWTNAPADPEGQGDLDLYYITVDSAGLVRQFDREAWPPNAADNPSTSSTFSDTDNIISNPQFVEVDFVSPKNIVVSGNGTVTPIAPDWSIVTFGSGTVTISQIAITNDPVPSSPPYVLDITVPALNAPLFLMQRKQNSPRLLSDQYISSYCVVQPQDGIDHLILMYYQLPDLSQKIIASQIISGTDYTEVKGTVKADLVGTTSADIGFIDYIVSIPSSSHVRISSIQVVGVENITSSTPFIQEPTDRQKDHLFHYWQPYLNIKPIPSHLTAWNFPQNPAQFGYVIAPYAVGANSAYYAWDQTIIFQSVSNSIGVSSINYGVLNLNATINTQMGIIQYLEGYKAQQILFDLSIYGLSSLAFVGSDQSMSISVSLWYTTNASLPDIWTNNSFVNSVDAFGRPNSVDANWFELTIKIPTPTARSLTGDGIGRELAFNWEQSLSTATIASATYFAIFVGTSAVTAGKNLFFESVSLVPGQIPTAPAAQSTDQVLRESQYYFETSYEQDTPFGTIGAANPIVVQQNTANTVLGGVNCQATSQQTGFYVPYKQIKRIAPVRVFYSNVTGIVNTVTGTLNYYNGAVNGLATAEFALGTYFDDYYSGTRGFGYFPNSAAFVANPVASPVLAGANSYAAGSLIFHYYADARLGVV
jgi:hypothetical protein